MRNFEFGREKTTIVTVGTERFCVPSRLINDLELNFKGSVLSLRFQLTPDLELGSPVNSKFIGRTTSITIQSVPGNVEKTTNELIEIYTSGAQDLGEDNGFHKYRGMPTDVFVDLSNSSFFFQCFLLPKYKRTSEDSYDWCVSTSAYTRTVRLSFTFPPDGISKVRTLRDSVMRLVAQIRLTGAS